ncbi:MAG: hypothetical protein J0H67_11745 [Rhodospirillales bacterium]|nr:hypothetical protein [Rhodospirillales bacterium]
MSLRGSLDLVTTTGVAGWVFSPEGRSKVTIQALLDNAVIGEAIADQHRPDLAAVGMGDGNCGYTLNFYNEIEPKYLPFVVVKPEGSDLDLPRSSVSGYAEFFHAMFRRYPACARTRSVFGGLWTDRIDAAAMLRDKVELGVISAELAEPIATFIENGFIVAPGGASSPESKSSRRDTAGGIDTADLGAVLRGTMQSDSLAGLLPAILEANPLGICTGIVYETNESFRQPSAMEASPSPGECVALIVPLGGEPVEIEVVRDSHRLPEFNAAGQSRWVQQPGNPALDVALQNHGLVDRHPIPAGSVALVGPGVLHRLRLESGAGALRVHVTPKRLAPLERVLDDSRKELELAGGGRIWV